MKKPPEVSDEEITGFMDFDRVLEKRNAVVRRRSIYRGAAEITAAVLIAVSVYLLLDNSARETPAPPWSQPEEQVVAPEVVPDLESSGSKEPVVREQTPPEKPEAKKPTSSEKTTEPVENIYIQAEPVAGYDSLFNYFRTHIRYPNEMVADSIQGVMTVSFVIGRNGEIRGIEFPKTLGEPFEREARNLIARMPQWKPATLNGKPVNSKVSLPLTFELIKVKTSR